MNMKEHRIQNSELNSVIISLQNKLIDVNSALITLQYRYMQLNQEMNDMRNANHQFEKYALYRFPRGELTYRYQVQENDPTPPHDICAHCKERNIKSILQTVSPNPFTEFLHCPACDNKIVIKSAMLQAKARQESQIKHQ